MSLTRLRRRVSAAEADVVRHHVALRTHLDGLQTARDALLRPWWIVGIGLLAGFALGRALPALRRSEVRQDLRRGTDAVEQLLRLLKSALPLAMPLWAALTAHRARDAAETAAEAGATAGGDGVDAVAATRH